MDDTVKAQYAAKSTELRADLKKWETEWAQSHDGKKPGRDDIKRNVDIAQKYKEYNKVRDILSGKIPPPDVDSQPKKRRSDPPPPPPVETPMKRVKHLETPSKDRMQNDDLMNTPAISRKLFSPTPITSLGPTPQRDGCVLGLFDLLVEKELGTPSKKTEERPTSRGRFDATPSKRKSPHDDSFAQSLGRTPVSASKRPRRDTFLTPLKNRNDNSLMKTPTSVSKLHFDTPSFLKRHSLPALDENGKFDAPAPLRLPRKPFARGLSEIVASLRKTEEDELDEEMDAMLEMERELAGEPRPKPPPKKADDVLLDDSQQRSLPLGGFDDEAIYDSPDEEQLDRNGNPLRVFKKKGQKRTTRRVNIRPTITKRPANPAGNVAEDEDDGDVVPETQAGVGDADFEAANLSSDSEFDEAPARGAKTKAATSSKAPKKEGTVKKVARKVNELAHANFHRLKLRQNGAKGGPGYNSRFRRRR